MKAKAILDSEFRFFYRAHKLRDLLTAFIEKTDEIGTADDILRERNLDDMPPNRVVAIARDLVADCKTLKKKIRKAAKALAKE